MRNKNRAMTLLELIVVITILAVLTAILLPVIRLTTERSLRTSCASNLRQIGQALAMYSQDSDGYYPSAVTWMERQAVSPVLGCPSIHGEPDLGRGYPGYAYTMESLKGPLSGRDTRGLPLASVHFPASTIAVGETIFGVHLMGMVPAGYSIVQDDCGKDKTKNCDDSKAKQVRVDTMAGSTRHNGGVNYLFFDSHVKWLRPGQILPSGGPNDGKAPTFSL